MRLVCLRHLIQALIENVSTSLEQWVGFQLPSSPPAGRWRPHWQVRVNENFNENFAETVARGEQLYKTTELLTTPFTVRQLEMLVASHRGTLYRSLAPHIPVSLGAEMSSSEYVTLNRLQTCLLAQIINLRPFSRFGMLKPNKTLRISCMNFQGELLQAGGDHGKQGVEDLRRVLHLLEKWTWLCNQAARL